MRCTSLAVAILAAAVGLAACTQPAGLRRADGVPAPRRGVLTVQASGCEAAYQAGPVPVTVWIYAITGDGVRNPPVETQGTAMGSLRDTFDLPPGAYLVRTSTSLEAHVHVSVKQPIAIALLRRCSFEYRTTAHTTDGPVRASELDQRRGDLSGVTCLPGGMCQTVGAFAVANPRHSVMAMYRTSDGGSTWVEELVPKRPGELNNVTCLSSSTCWAAGSTNGFDVPRILRTTDGGASWSQLAPVALRGEPMAISCSSMTSCVAGGVLSRIGGSTIISPLVTTDAGRQWAIGGQTRWMAGVSGLSCPTSSTCELVGTWVSSMGTGQFIGRSNDGGRSWSEQRPELRAFNTSLSSVTCTSTLTCEAVGAASGCQRFMHCPPTQNVTPQGLALRTTDGGSQWSRQWLPRAVKDLQAIWCDSSLLHCVAVGIGFAGSAVAIRTNDGGSHWTLGAVLPRTWSLSAVSCQSENRCIAVGFRGGPWPHLTLLVARTTDGGDRWSR